jgi:hypothetical protein
MEGNVKKLNERLSELRADLQKVRQYRHSSRHVKVVGTLLKLESRLMQEVDTIEQEIFG